MAEWKSEGFSFGVHEESSQKARSGREAKQINAAALLKQQGVRRWCQASRTDGLFISLWQRTPLRT